LDLYKQSLDEQLKDRYSRWEHLYKYGGSDPNWSDGCNMNLIRNHIINIKKQMEESGQFTNTYYRDLPPEVNRDYMARADEIRKNAKDSLKAYKNHTDYLFLLDAIKLLNKRQIEETCIDYVTGYVKGLEMFIERDNLIDMRRHEHPERYIESFVSCRKKVEQILGYKPKIIYFSDNKQLQGQMNIFDFI
jgi:hypothetical protein